jgi:hypothetical protein
VQKPDSKKDRKAAVRELIDRYQFSYPFNAKDTETINKLTGWNFAGYKRVKNPVWRTDLRCLAHTTDGTTWEVASWNKAIDNYGTFNNLLEALRLVVRPQMKDYAAQNVSKCTTCSAEENLTVDHKAPPFTALVRKFMEANPGLMDTLGNDNNGVGWYIADATASAEWAQFHKATATYQILCRSCNSKKGTKHDSEER